MLDLMHLWMMGATGVSGSDVFYGRASSGEAGKFSNDLSSNTPATTGSGAQIVAANSTYLFLSQNSSPYLRRLPRSNLSDTATAPGATMDATVQNATQMAINIQGTWLAFCDRNAAGRFSAVSSDMATIISESAPTSAVRCITWNTAGTRIYIGMGSSPFLAYMDFNGSAFSGYTAASGGNIPDAAVDCIDVSSSGSVICGGSTFIHKYASDLTGKASPVSAPPASVGDIKWDIAGAYFISSSVGITSNSFRIYNSSLVQQSSPSQPYTGPGATSGKEMGFNGSGNVFYAAATDAASATSYVVKYDYAGGALTNRTYAGPGVSPSALKSLFVG